MSLLFNTLSRTVMAFLPKSKHLLISWLQSLSTVILKCKKIKSVTVSTFSPSVCHDMMVPHAMILIFGMLSFKSAFHYPLSLLSRSSLVPFQFLLLERYHLNFWYFFSLGLECNLIFFSPVATPEFFKFAVILSATF